MPPSDNSLYKTRTAAAKKRAQRKSREADLPNPLPLRQHPAFGLDRTRRALVLVERVIDAVYPPSAPGERDSLAMFKQFSLDPRGLDLTYARWRAMDWEERLDRSYKWLQDHAECVRKALPALPGRPIDQKTWDIYDRFLEWCRENDKDPYGRIPPEFMMDCIEGLYPEWTHSSDKRRHALVEGVRLAIKSARKFLELA